MTVSVNEFIPETANTLIEEVMERSGQNLLSCYQCRRCAAGCPVAEETGYVTPDRLIRMIMLGDYENALNNPLVWKCVSCYTCGTRCPNGIHTARITETMKKLAKENHLQPERLKVVNFHGTFINSGIRWGRVNEMEFMGLYELKNTFPDINQFNFKPVIEELKTQARLAKAMLKKKRLHFGFELVKGRREIKKLYKKIKKLRKKL
ncbi:MAG: heterodisulfide reductase subunit C-like protein [Deltaproteobacteria bacterium]|nr:heterodisulfide reductase subunit C-like protein [Deltaproteobacteria bacterium]